MDEKDVENYKNKYKNTGTGAVVPTEDKPKKKDKQGKADNGSGGTSSGGNNSSNTNKTTDYSPPAQTVDTNTAALNQNITVLPTAGQDYITQQRNEFMQQMLDKAAAKHVMGRIDPPKVVWPTIADTLAIISGQQAAKNAVPKNYQGLGSGGLVDKADKTSFNLGDWLKNKWQEGQEQIGQYQQSGIGAIYQPQDFGAMFRTPSGGVVMGDELDFPSRVDDDGEVTTLPTYEQFVRYITGADKEGGRSAENNQSYLGKSLNQFLLGNYTDDVTALGTAGQVAAGFFDLDLPMDILDLTYDITNWESTPEHIGQTALDAIGLIPVIGMVKYGDEVGTLLKGIGKNAEEIADVAKEAEDVAAGAGKVKVGSFDDLPDTAKSTYDGYDSSGWKGTFNGQTPGTGAGGIYKNRNDILPTTDAAGNPITYTEFDVNNYVSGASRDTERFVVGSDGSIYYTDSHYGDTTSSLGLPPFVKIK